MSILNSSRLSTRRLLKSAARRRTLAALAVTALMATAALSLAAAASSAAPFGLIDSIKGIVSPTPSAKVAAVRPGSQPALDATSAVATSPTDYFQTQPGGGAWSDPATWQSSPDNATWVPATLSPTSAANAITINNFDTVVVTSDVTIDQTTVGTGAFLKVFPGVTLTVNDGSGTDLTISPSAQLQDYGPIINNGQIQIDGTLGMFGGSLSAAPSYGAFSVLSYNGTNPTNRGAEWTPGATTQPGYPTNVTMFGVGTFNLANGTTNQPFQISGNLNLLGSAKFDMTGLTKPLTVLGSVSNGDTITLSDQAGGDLKVAGNFTNNGTFNARSRTVTLIGSTDQTISGNTTFYDLTKSVSSPQTLKFAAGSTTTVTDWLIVTGTSGNLLSLASTSPGSQWNLVAGTTITANYVNVRDSKNTGTTIVPNNGSVDGGNNVGWAFPHTLTVAISGDGSVASSPPGISCPSACSADFATDVSLTATGSTGSHFVNWTGSVTSTSNPVSVTMSTAKSVTANFAIDQHTVTFNANGGGGSMSPQTRNYNSAANLTANSFTRTGYAFAGWNTQAGGGGTSYTDQASYNFTADLTLYAQWTINSYTLTYNGNGSTGGTPPTGTTQNYNTTIAVAGPGSLVKAGTTFAGWNTAANGSGTPYAPSDTFTFTANTTLYAQWTANNYTLSYNANGGTGTDPASSSVAYNSSTTTAANPYTRTGFAMTGWNTAANGSGTHANAGGSFTMPASDTTLYAEWKGTVAYNGNNATGGTVPTDASSPYFAGSTVTVLGGGSMVRNGYTFAGWNTQANGNGANYAPASTFTMSGNLLLYAKWTNVSAPNILYTPIPNTTSTTNPTVVVTASDPDGISSMAIVSKVNGGSFNPGDSCTLATGTATNGTWNCTIAGTLTSPSSITYYVTATDNTGATGINPTGGVLAPNLYTIGNAPVPAGTYDYLSLSDGATLGGDILVTGTLNLGGTVSTASKTLEMACSGVVTGAGGYNYVVGNIKKDLCGAGSFTFPSGTTPNGARPTMEAASMSDGPAVDQAEYTPLTMTVNSGTFPAAVTVFVTDATMSGLDPTKSVSRYWDVTLTGGPINADMAFTYLGSTLDIPATANETDFKVYKNDDATIVEVPSTLNTGTHTATVTGVTSFSKWGVGILGPSAASAVVSGRVITWDGRGIQNAMITASDLSGQPVATVITGPFGYYSVGGLEVGQTYVLTVSSKRFRFASPSRIVGLVDDVAGFDFVANP